MKKVYINNTPLIFSSDFLKVPQKYKNKQALLVRYTGKSKSLLNYIDNLEKNNDYTSIIVVYQDLKTLWKDFKNLYKIIEAAGGLVINDQEEMLLIYRMKHWDLPKGKIEKGEKRKVAAMREVEEETGAKGLKINKKILVSYHTYKNPKGKRILKKTHWYHMNTKKQALIPQIEEDIEQTIWLKMNDFSTDIGSMYPNILEVIKKCLILGKF